MRRTLVATAGAVGAFLLSACSPINALNAITPSGTYTLAEGIAYGSNARQRLDIYKPTSPAPAGGYPVAVFFYGGSWNTGERGQYKFVGEALASRGVVTVIPDYRLYPEVKYPDFLNDSAMAMAYALKNTAALGGNPKRVFVTGHSAGGYNAGMLALDARWLAATGHSPKELAGWAALAGAFDFFPTSNEDVQPVFFHPNYPKGALPIEHVTAASPRAFFAVAVEDKLVYPEKNTDPMAAKLRALGVPVEVKRYDNVSHITLAGALSRPLRWKAPVLDDLSAFLNQTPAKNAE
jgi:acetyl esterase/lipase